jgi:hypothetical protein
VVIEVLLELATDNLAVPSLTAGSRPKSRPEIKIWLVRLLTVTRVITE